MVTDKQTREAIFSNFSERTQGIFSYRRNDLFDNSKAFSLILEMLVVEKTCSPKTTSSRENIMNQGKEKLAYQNGVDFGYDANGKFYAREA